MALPIPDSKNAHSRTAGIPGTLCAGALGGAFAGAAAQLLDLAVNGHGLRVSEGVAALTAAAALGLILSFSVLGILTAARAGVGRRPGDLTRARWLVGSSVGTLALLYAAGVAWMAGAVASLDALPGVVRVATWAVPSVSLLAALSAGGLIPAAWLRSASTGRFSLVATAGSLALLGLAAALLSFRGESPVSGVAFVGASLIPLAWVRWQGSRRPAIATLACAAGFAVVTAIVWPGSGTPAPPAAPHRAPGSVVLVVLDTLRADAVGAYGGPAGATPTLDALAREGTLFEQVTSPSPWTVPSHASLFTGLFPRTHRCWFGDRRWLDNRFVTLADRFRAADYETAAFVSNGYLLTTNLLQGFQLKQPIFGAIDELVLTRLMRATGIGWERWIDKGAAEGLLAIDRWLNSRDPERPFFLFLNLFEVHEPYQPPLGDRELPPGRSNLAAIRATQSFDSSRWHSLRKRNGPTEEVLRALYASEVRYQDRQLGQILALLESHARVQDFALVVTSDHGENLGEGGRWGHVFALNDALIQVPLIVRAPGRFGSGEREPRPFQTLDIGPTLLALAGLEPKLGEGRSLMPEVRRARQHTFAEVYPDYFRIARMRVGIVPGLGDFRRPIQSVRSNGRKRVVWGEGRAGRAGLYAPAVDPGEERDLSTAEPNRARALDEALEVWAEQRPRGRRPTAGDGPVPLDPEVRRRLEALGYF